MNLKDKAKKLTMSQKKMREKKLANTPRGKWAGRGSPKTRQASGNYNQYDESTDKPIKDSKGRRMKLKKKEAKEAESFGEGFRDRKRRRFYTGD